MIFKIRTSKKTMDIFGEIGSAEGLQPYILSKLAISMSLKMKEALAERDFHTDVNGLELNRQTITGDFDTMYKCLIEMYEKRHLAEDEYFQTYVKAHLDRGARALYSEYKYQNNFLTALLCDKESI